MCLGVPLQSVSLFLPVVIKALGYSTVKTNLYTVAPNITGAVMLLILAFVSRPQIFQSQNWTRSRLTFIQASDYTRLRFPFVAAGFAFTFIGFIIFASVSLDTQIHVAYFACFMMTWGTSAPSVILDVWYNNNIADENKRVMLTSVGVPVANLMGVVRYVLQSYAPTWHTRGFLSLKPTSRTLGHADNFCSSNIFQNKDAPKYLPALITTATFGAVGCLLTLGLGAWMVIDNKRRNLHAVRNGGKAVHAKDVPSELLRDGPNASEYRWFY
jgi:hypothetical protein